MDQTHQTVAECQQMLRTATVDVLGGLIARLEYDERIGVRNAVDTARRRLERDTRERDRLMALAAMETELRRSGLTIVVGTDEVGRGALAGPVTAGACVLSNGLPPEGLNDSKKLSPQRRRSLSIEIKRVAVAWSVSHTSPERIDTLGITGATFEAMRSAIDTLGIVPSHVLVDGAFPLPGIESTPVIAGDGRVACIAAASILAKVERDALMEEYDEKFPGYEFASNKGYGTNQHIQAIDSLGPSRIHRITFSPCDRAERLF